LATYFLPNNRGKKSVTVDLTSAEGKRQILRLSDIAHVVLDRRIALRHSPSRRRRRTRGSGKVRRIARGPSGSHPV